MAITKGEYDMTMKKYAVGYLYGLSGSLADTILFVLAHVLIFIYRNGVGVYLKFWDYPRYMLFVGIVISVIPAGLSGMLLAHLLWKELENGKLSRKQALYKGGLVGAIGILIIFAFILITPLAGVFFRMGDIGVIYLIVAFIAGISTGGWTGLSLADTLLREN